MTLPNSDDLAERLLEAAGVAANLHDEQMAAWNAARTARFNRDLCRAQAVSDAYADGGIDGKNEAQRSAQLDYLLLCNERLTAHEATLRQAEANLKQAELLLEAARVYRSALHDLVALRVAELGVEAAKLPWSKAQLGFAQMMAKAKKDGLSG